MIRIKAFEKPNRLIYRKYKEFIKRTETDPELEASMRRCRIYLRLIFFVLLMEMGFHFAQEFGSKQTILDTKTKWDVFLQLFKDYFIVAST